MKKSHGKAFLLEMQYTLKIEGMLKKIERRNFEKTYSHNQNIKMHTHQSTRYGIIQSKFY